MIGILYIHQKNTNSFRFFEIILRPYMFEIAVSMHSRTAITCIPATLLFCLSYFCYLLLDIQFLFFFYSWRITRWNLVVTSVAFCMLKISLFQYMYLCAKTFKVFDFFLLLFCFFFVVFLWLRWPFLNMMPFIIFCNNEYCSIILVHC